MFPKFSTRRNFLKYCKFSLLLLLNSCVNVSRKSSIALQKSLYPKSFKELIPNSWEQKNINSENLNFYSKKERNSIISSDFTLINDGWINKINFENFKEINKSILLEKLNKRSKVFLSNFEEKQRNKLFPIGVVPYAVVIKKNQQLVKLAEKSWDFLLSKKLTKKIIFPQSPRIIISIAEKINSTNSLGKLKKRGDAFDDKCIKLVD